MTQPVLTTYGSCIDFDLIFKTEDGTPEDVSTDSFSVAESYPGIIEQAAVLTITDGASGVVHFHLPAEAAQSLLVGNLNSLRILRTFADGCSEATEKFGISVR